MKKITAFILIYLSSFIFINNLLFAQMMNSSAITLDDSTTGAENEGRFALSMMKGRSTQNTSIPAMVIDTFQGIVWVCEDLGNSRPIWLKTDLAQNKEPLSNKRYIGRIMEWQEGNFKVPAIIIDTEEGKVWTCADVTGNGEVWSQADFQNSSQQEIRGAQIQLKY